MRSIKLNVSYKHHLKVALIIAIWLVFFLIIIAPFDIEELPFLIRLEILPMYGLISFIGYLILIPAQNWIFKKLNQWNIVLESFFLILFNLIVLFGSYLYYNTDIINGTFSFTKFTLEVYYPTFFILLPILFFSRWYLNRKAIQQDSSKIILKGENRHDILQIPLSDLVCISSADNYVEVSYLIKNELHKKLLRITLKNIYPQAPNLLKVHRSYLINPSHFKDWKNSNTIYLTQMEVPISKNYKKELLQIVNHSSLKASNSPQSY